MSRSDASFLRNGGVSLPRMAYATSPQVTKMILALAPAIVSVYWTVVIGALLWAMVLDC